MFRLWAKMIQKGRVIRDTVVTDGSDRRRTAKVLQALSQVCNEFDLPQPIWLESCIRDFKRHAKTRFDQDSFIEPLPCDYLEIQVIEEDP